MTTRVTRMPLILHRFAPMAALFLLYFVVGKIGFNFGFIHPLASAIWPPTAIAIAALLIFGNRIWPAIFVGAFLINVTNDISFLTALGIALGSTLEGVAAAFLINRFANGAAAFERTIDILKFAALAILSTIISASIGVVALFLGDNTMLYQMPLLWLTWWLGDASGAIAFTPLLVLWWFDHSWKRDLKQLGEVILLFASLALVAYLIFFQSGLDVYPFSFLTLLPLAWAAFRFNQREVATGIAILALVATWGTITGHGPFVMRTAEESLLVLQAFIATLAVTVLPLSALVAERTTLLERERVARTAAETANRDKDQFIAMLSHELRNPLNAISMAVFVLEQSNKIDAETSRWTDAIHRQTEQLTHIIDDLLDVTRVTTGKINLMLQPVDVAEIIARSVHALTTAGRLGQHQLDIQTDTVWVEGDATRLEQVVTNLLTNAIKYTPAGGTIHVRTYGEKSQACIRVDDTGIGISAELLPRVFDLFTQGDQSLDRTQGGLGVGLALVRRLAQLHHGNVEAHSKGQDCGSSFIVRLPRIEPPAVHPANTNRFGEQPKNGLHRVLIVEDNPDSRRALRTILEIAGHEVNEAANGSTAIEIARKVNPDVALVDIGLPGIDGYELARRFKKDSVDLKLVAVTGYGRKQDRQRAYEAGFDAHLVKPVDPERLNGVIDELFNQAVQPSATG